MAQARPLAVVEGLNAALLSNAQRGPLDLPSTAPQGPVLVQVARWAGQPGSLQPFGLAAAHPPAFGAWA